MPSIRDAKRWGPYRQRQCYKGYFQVQGRRLRRTLASFAELGLDENGEPHDRTPRARDERARLLLERWHTVNEELRAADPTRADRPARISDLMATWREERGTLSEGTQAIDRLMAESYLELVGDHGVWELATRGRRRYPGRHAAAFLRGLQARKVALETQRLRVRTLIVFLNWCIRADALDPPHGVHQPHAEPRNPGALTDEDVQALLALIRRRMARSRTDSPRWRRYHLHERYVVTALGTGATVGELHPRQWKAHLDLKGARILLDSAQPGRPHAETGARIKRRAQAWQPILPFAVEYLRAVRERYPDEVWLFDDGDGALAFERYAMTRTFARYFRELGIAGRGIKATHGFRATAITNMLRDGADLSTAGRFARHRQLSTTAGYNADPDGLLRAAIEKADQRYRAAGDLAPSWHQADSDARGDPKTPGRVIPFPGRHKP